MPITLRVAAATALISALILGLFPGIDREAARLFFNADLNAFPVAATQWGKTVRWLGMYLPHLTWMVATAAIIVALLRPSRLMPMRPSIAIFLIVTALAVPALVVNGGFKQNWGRPRPVHVAEFGGKQAFHPWWDNSGTCRRNCSFMSGEVSAAAMLVGVATLAPLTIRPLAMTAAGLFMLLIGLMRVAFGGHWLSDVLMGGSISVLLILAARHIILVTRGIDDAGARHALSQTGLLLQGWRRAQLGALRTATGRFGTAVARGTRVAGGSAASLAAALAPVGTMVARFARTLRASALEWRGTLFPAKRPSVAPAE